MNMNKSMMTKLEELVDNIKINGNVTRGCERKMTVTPQPPSSCLVNVHGNGTSAALEPSEREKSGIAPSNFREQRFPPKVRNRTQIRKTYSLITRNSSESSNTHSLQGSENSSKKKVHTCKIPTRIKGTNLSVEEIHKLIDKILKNIKEVSYASPKEAMNRTKNVSKFIQNHIFDVSGTDEPKTRSRKKKEKNLNKTYIKPRTPMTVHGKYNVDSIISRNNSPLSSQHSNDSYGSKRVSNETGLGESVSNSERMLSVTDHNILDEPIQKQSSRKHARNSLKNGSNNTGNVENYDSKIVIPSLYTPEKYCTDISNRGTKSYQKYPGEYVRRNKEERSSKYSTFDYASISHPRNEDIDLLNCQANSSKTFNIIKNLKKFESTHIEYSEDLLTQKIPEHYTPRISSECSAEKKKILHENILKMVSKTYKTPKEYSFVDDLPNVGTYEEFLTDRLNERDNVKVYNRKNTLFEDIQVGTYEEFKKELLNKDQKRLRGLTDSMFISGNIVMGKLNKLKF